MVRLLLTALFALGIVGLFSNVTAAQTPSDEVELKKSQAQTYLLEKEIMK